VTLALRAISPIAGGWLSATLAAVGVALLLPLTTFLVGAWLLGWQLQSVQSGSMLPTYPVGSLLVVETVDPADVSAGTPLVFRDSRDTWRLVTHRVIEVRAADGTSPVFITKGDANASPDSLPVTAAQVRGRVLWSVTHLGNAMEWVQFPRSLVLIIVPAVLLLFQGRAPRGRGADAAQPQATRAA
jgi:signal peptidase